MYSSMRSGRRRAGYASDSIHYESTRRSTFPAVSPTTPAAASSTSGIEKLNVGRTLAMCSSLPQVGDSFDILREVDPSGIRNGQKYFEPTCECAKTFLSSVYIRCQLLSLSHMVSSLICFLFSINQNRRPRYCRGVERERLPLCGAAGEQPVEALERARQHQRGNSCQGRLCPLRC